MDNYGRCPECGTSWKGEGVYKLYLKFEWFRKMTRRERIDYVKTRYSKPYYMSRLIGIEDPMVYDGVSWYMCPDCKVVFDRWSGNKTDKKFEAWGN